MAVVEQSAKITFVSEAASPIALRSSTPISEKNIKVIVREIVNEQIVIGAKSSQLIENPAQAIVEFHGQRWRVEKVIQLYGSPNYDLELYAARIA